MTSRSDRRVTWADVWSHTRGWLRDVLLSLAERLDEERGR